MIFLQNKRLGEQHDHIHMLLGLFIKITKCLESIFVECGLHY